MVVIVITLAEADEGDQPAVAAAVLRAVGLSPDHMAEGVDGEGRIEDHEHPEQAAHEEPTDAPEKRAVPQESDTEGDGKTRSNNHPVILVLPENHRIAAQSNFIFTEPMRRMIEQPAAVAVPEPSGGIVGVFIRIRARVMTDVVRSPDQCRIL